MEKQALLGEPHPAGPAQAPRTRRRRSLPAILTLCIAAALARHVFLNPIRPPKPGPSFPAFDWRTASAAAQLEFVPCYGEFQCARLEVPMDYFNGTTDAHVGLAVVKKPAKVKVTHPQYGGPVLLNPGGPGGSGVALVLNSAAKIGEVIDTNLTASPDELGEGKYFDLISWDPRGVGDTLPGISCATDKGVGWAWQMRVMEEGILGSSDASLGRLWSMAKARGGSCSLPPADGSPDLKRYASTASTARDMVSIVEAHGEWREREAAKLLGIPPPGKKGPKKRIQVPQKLKWNRGAEKLQYWGFSYGTYLGLTFAAMFPDKIERMVVDGVVDTYDYRKTLWYDNLVDTEKDMDQFYSNCARVGYPTCALANSTSAGKTTPEGVKARADSIIRNLYHDPLPVIAENPEVITYSDVRNLIFGGLYSPVDGFPLIANLLADIEKGNGTRFANLLREYHTPYCASANDHPSPRTSHTMEAINAPWTLSNTARKQGLGPDGLTIISCTDGDPQSHLTKSQFKKHLQKEIALSPSIGAMWSTVRMECVHLTIRAHHRFTAPFAANTSHPLLLIGNTADPVTPARNAVKLAKAYRGSVALIQDSPGHCSLSAASRCTVGWIKGYFQRGVLPAEGTICPVDEKPFGEAAEKEMGVEDPEVREVKEAVKGVREGLFAAGGFGRVGW